MRHYTEDYKIENGIVEPEESKPVTESLPVEPEKPDPVVTKISRRGRATRLVNFRKDPMQSSPVTDVVMIGSVVDILGSERDCYKIRYKGKEGYAKKYAFVEVR